MTESAPLTIQRAKVPAELHIYASGDHDFGVRQNGQPPSSWAHVCVDWLKARGVL